MTTQDEKTTALPGLLSTVAAGFDVVTRHIWLVTLPIILDIFYWVGPQLRSTELWLSLADLIREVGMMGEMADQLVGVAGHTNQFTFLSVPFLGISGLMAGIVMPEQTPIQPLAWEIGNAGVWLFLSFAILFAGLLASAVYHGFVARAVCMQDDHGCHFSAGAGQAPWRSLLRRIPVYCLRVIGLAILLLALVVTLYVPLMLAATVATLISPALGSLVILSGMLMILWVLFYFSFGLHGILLRERPVFRALFDSLRLVRRNWRSALMLFVLIIAVRNLLSWIWLLVDSGAWFNLVNIAGYAYVNAGLVAATFIFYRDRIRLLERGFLNE